MDAVLVAVVVLLALPPGSPFPNGAPTSACEDMVPRHTGVQVQPAPAPYTIHTSSRTFHPNQAITVAIKGSVYRGVLLEARSGDGLQALGRWQFPPANTRFLQCSGNPQGAVTHSNTNEKNNSTLYIWMPPSGLSSVYFKATVAQQRTVFWLDVRSEILTTSSIGGMTATGGGGSTMWNQGFLLLLISSLLLTQLMSS
ncbi:putative defense protein 3 [Arapaima gigas]